jgi:hypothetical protein
MNLIPRKRSILVDLSTKTHDIKSLSGLIIPSEDFCTVKVIKVSKDIDLKEGVIPGDEVLLNKNMIKNITNDIGFVPIDSVLCTLGKTDLAVDKQL